MESSVLTAKKDDDFVFKLVLVGDSGVGKSQLFQGYTSYKTTFINTFGVDFKYKTIELEGMIIKLQIWDTVDDVALRSKVTPYFRDAMGFILMYDITRQNSLKNITGWIRVIQEHACQDVEMLLIGNKCDLEARRAVPIELGAKFAKSWRVPFLETSAKTNININEAFELLARQVLNKALLHFACATGNLSLVMKQLNSDRNPNATDRLGNTPLHITASRGHTEICELLLSLEPCDPNCQNGNGDTPLHLATACKAQSALKCVECLLAKRQCNPSIQNQAGYTPLHIATEREDGKLFCEKLISDRKCDPCTQNHNGNNPLHIASMLGNDDIAQFLIVEMKRLEKSLSIKNRDGNTALHLACYRGNKYVVRLLLAARCDARQRNNKDESVRTILMQGRSLLYWAFYWKDVNIIDYLVNHESCDVNCEDDRGRTALHNAILDARSISMIEKVLASRGCNPNISDNAGNAPLHSAVMLDREEVVDLLVKSKRCDLTITAQNNSTPLHLAVTSAKLSIVTTLLQEDGVDPTIQDASGNAPLHLAIIRSQCSMLNTSYILQLLVQKMKNLSIQNRDGNTALHLACYGECINVIRLLLVAKCDTRLTNIKNESPQTILVQGKGLLHWACHSEDVIAIDHLVNHESYDVNQRDCQGQTPLHYAILDDKNISVIEALLASRCDPNITDNAGNAPLQSAVVNGREEVVVMLVKSKICYLNVRDQDGNTLLHLAIVHARTSIATFLLQQDNVDPSIQNTSGDTPLHLIVISGLASKFGTGPILQLIQKMQNLNVQNGDGNTVLHLACYGGDTHVMNVLLAARCDTRMRNSKNDCPQTMLVQGKDLLRWACHWEDVNIVDHLVKHESYDVNRRDPQGRTPLNDAILDNRNIYVIKALLNSKECNPNLSDTAGNAPIHSAVMQDRQEVVDLLTKSKVCDVNIPDQNGNTPLHLAAAHAKTSIVTCLLQRDRTDPTVQNASGNTPLHLAIINGQAPITTILLQQHNIDPNVPNFDGSTALHLAIINGQVSIANVLLQHGGIDPIARNTDGNSPLHLACKVESEDDSSQLQIVKLLLSHPLVDPECVNKAGQTPVELTKNYRLIEEISYVTKCKTKHAIQTYIKIFFIGNPGTGKSTLVKAVCKQAGWWWKLLPGFLRRVKGVPPCTAGIIPTTFHSKEFGNAVLYDLAGQLEYYSSHAAVIESTVLSSPPAFLVLVNLNEPIDDISSKVRYWWSFIANCATHASAPPHLILVGSHADMVGKENAKAKLTQVVSVINQSGSIHFAGYISLDCRNPASKGLRTICSRLEQSCSILRKAADVDLHCHVLYALLINKLPDQVACKVSEIVTQIEAIDALLPKKPEKVVQLLSSLSDRGLILLVKNTSSIQDSWVVLQKETLLSEINGTVFAPENFKENKRFSLSTGVVPLSKIRNEFPQYNCEMTVGFLTHLEFCFKIDDPETLKIIEGEATNRDSSDVSQPDPNDEYYFFPALVSTENPLHVWRSSKMVYQCCWLYKSVHSQQFLTTRFLHVLILRLAFFFALAPDDADIPQDSIVLRRRCSVWKHGIEWLNRDGIKTVVEVGLQCQWVAVTMQCPKGAEVKCAQLRSAIIRMALNIKQQFCPTAEMSESFVHPPEIKCPIAITDDLTVYKLSEVAKVLSQNKDYVVDKSGNTNTDINELLFFEPYFGFGAKLLEQLFDSSNATKEIPDSALRDMIAYMREQNLMEVFMKAVVPHPARFAELCVLAPNDPVRQCLYLLQILKQSTERATFQEFKEILDHFSVFCGRNPLEVAGFLTEVGETLNIFSDRNPLDSTATTACDGAAAGTRALSEAPQGTSSLNNSKGPLREQYVVPLSNVIDVCDVLKKSGFSTADWESLAPRLGVTDTKSIWTVHQRDPFLCLYDVISQWLQCDLQASWDKLATAVSNVEGYGSITSQTILMNTKKEVVTDKGRKDSLSPCSD